MIKLSDYVMQFVADLGVKHVFMVPGGGAMHLNASLGARKDVRFVCNLHEQACAMAAETYAKVTGNIGVAHVTTGPGGTNTITGVAGAWLDSTPCLFISGQVKRADMIGDSGVRQVGVQEVDIVAIVTPITKYAVTVMEPETIRYHLERAVHIAKTGRPGPVWIDIPLDVQAAPIDPEKLGGYTPEPAPPAHPARLKDQVVEVVELLNKSERPILLAGNGIRLAGARAEFEQLVARLGIPVLNTWLAIDLLPEDHQLFVGRPGPVAPRGANFALQNSDLLLAIGARLDRVVIGYAPDKLARGAAKVMVDIDPAELRKLEGFIEIPVCADAKSFITELLAQSDALKTVERAEWMRRCGEWKTKYPLVLPEHRESETISTYYFSEVLSDELAENDVIVSGSSGAGIEMFLLVLKIKPGQRVLHTTALGSMGYGLPACIGAGMAVGAERRIISVDGDGGFQMNIQELETVARLRLPIKFFVLNNDGYSSIRTSQQKYFGKLSGVDATSGMTLPQLSKVANAYGLAARLISDPATMREEIRDVLASPGAIVCEVIVTPDEPRMPSLASAQRPDGSMVSKPLEDLWPFLDRDEFMSNMIVSPIPE